MADVLVVDDSKVFRDLVAMLLENEGFRVRTAVDGADAVQQLAARPPDALVLDLIMPNGNGEDVLRARQEQQLAPDAYVVVLTADDSPERPAELAGLGVTEFVTKPFDCDRFVAALRDRMEARGVITQNRPESVDQ